MIVDRRLVGLWLKAFRCRRRHEPGTREITRCFSMAPRLLWP